MSPLQREILLRKAITFHIDIISPSIPYIYSRNLLPIQQDIYTQYVLLSRKAISFTIDTANPSIHCFISTVSDLLPRLHLLARPVHSTYKNGITFTGRPQKQIITWIHLISWLHLHKMFFNSSNFWVIAYCCFSLYTSINDCIARDIITFFRSATDLSWTSTIPPTDEHSLLSQSSRMDAFFT